MADHRAEQIMAAVQDLVTGLFTTGDHVDRGRADEIPPAQTPALRVAMGDDLIVDPWSSDLLDSHVEVSVFAIAATSAANVETQLNQIRKEVNIALVTDYTLGLAFVHAIVELGARRPSLAGELAKPVGALELQYQVKYRRSRTDPSA